MKRFTFRRSLRKDKKYDVVFDDGSYISFGAIKRNGEPYQQFKDSTPLKLFSAYDHGDKERRLRYYARHGSMESAKPYSPDWFSKRYLW